MKRDTAHTIFRTVVFAGAMLGAPACGKKPAPAAPKNTTTEPAKGSDPAMMKGDEKPATEGTDDPCAGGGRARGTSQEGGESGRGFILS
jgi:hypothetical protein